MKVDKHHTNRPVPCPYRKHQLESNNPDKLTKPHSFGYSEACALLQAIELNQRQRLSKKCLVHLALFVSQAWEDKPCQVKIQQLYYMMNNLLDTTSMDSSEPFDAALQKFCQNSVSTPTICPSVTLLIAISYVERLNKRYKHLKGTPGCGSRMIMVAFIMASKYIHDSLKMIIYTCTRKLTKAETPITPPTSPKLQIHSTNTTIQNITAVINQSATATADVTCYKTATTTTEPPTVDICDKEKIKTDEKPTIASSCSETTPDKERNLRIARMEQEFLFFLNYDLSVQDPSLLVRWAQSYQLPEKNDAEAEEEYTSADEGDDEMEDDE